ncbi:hypothetical protein O181_102622 [Austropuccinia psidii MF-1]|uniref:Copia protein n=1 Tax=Austropuccinia psidii MF-1 TaxID=1389203 RepID=A0A9Q3JJI5_9BASI|nr:hypothetical protein [Austropuccinia psidii MF-1]
MTRAILVPEDNQGCIDTANSDCNTKTHRMKHIDIQLHFIRDLIENKIIELTYTPTANMLAHFLTKSVSRPAIRRAMQELQLLTTGDKGGVEICDLSQSIKECFLFIRRTRVFYYCVIIDSSFIALSSILVLLVVLVC